MSSITTRIGDWLTGMKAGCERMVHPSVAPAERARHARLAGLLLTAPFVAASALVQTLVPALGPAAALSAMFATFGLAWLLALQLARGTGSRAVEIVALAGAAVIVTALAGFGGGAAAPLAVLAAALPVEAYWVARSRRAAAIGGAAGLCAILGGAFMTSGSDAAVSAWQWITPALYAASLVARFRTVEAGGEASARDERGLPESAFEAVALHMSRTGEVETASQQAREILGVEPALLLATGFFERVHVADRVALLCALSQAADVKRSVRVSLRVRMPVTADGGAGYYRPFEMEILDTKDGLVGLLRDGAETAALRQELAEALDRAGATEVAKGRFLAAVSHELRTPLNAIIGFSDLLLHPVISEPLGAKQSEHVTLIREAGNHLLSVVNAILDVSKIESGSYQIIREPFELSPAVDLCCAMLEPAAQAKGVSLGARIPQDLGRVDGDQRAVQQILINLVSNAIKFTPAGGSVSVNAGRQGEMIRIFVNDTGIGIAGDDLARLGEPFMQVQNDYTRQVQGTGLGLSLVKGLVTLHKGMMSIESAPGLGTTVTIGLPVAANEGQEKDVGPAHPVARAERAGEGNGIALRKIA